MNRVLRLFCLLGALFGASWIPARLLGQGDAKGADAGKVKAGLRESLQFHASFDGSFDADFATGERRMQTAATLERKQVEIGQLRDDVVLVKGAGKYGDALRFQDRSPKVLLYSGDNMHFSEKDWSGTVSFWMKLNPDKDLKPGYCDPIQITDKAWNDAAFFVDFDKDVPRDFRLGVFSNLKYWNPDNVDWEKWPVAKRPMVTVKQPPFSSERWTQVAFTFEGINASVASKGSVASLYLDGKLQGKLQDPNVFTWDLSKVSIMLGIEYIGDFDDLAIFKRALSEAEIRQLYELPQGISGLK